MIAAAQEVLAHVRGEIELPSYEVAIPPEPDVSAIRRKLKMSQRVFAGTFGLDVTALHAWEQGRRRPDRAARVLLAVIDKDPEAVKRALVGGHS